MKSKPKISNSDRYVIIMAGGRGERFWPVSREQTPKQLIALLGRKSFLQEAVDRVLPLVPLRNILVITNQVQAPQVAKQLPKLPKQNIIGEPVGRDTCAAVTLGAAIALLVWMYILSLIVLLGAEFNATMYPRTVTTLPEATPGRRAEDLQSRVKPMESA